MHQQNAISTKQNANPTNRCIQHLYSVY